MREGDPGTREHQRPDLTGAKTPVAFGNRGSVGLSSCFKKTEIPIFMSNNLTLKC